MIEHEILFLGLLMEGPKHGYDIKLQIENELVPFIGLKIKSIYYPLEQMEKAGLIAKAVGQEGKWPKKFIYRITPKGKKEFNRAITKSFISVERPFFQIDLSLYFLRYVDNDVAKRRLTARVQLLKKIRKDLASLIEKSRETAKGIPIILRHDLDLVDAEIQSITHLISRL